MKNLNEIFDTKYNVMINDIKTNSKEINEGDLFVCIKGFNADRHDYVSDAEKMGAKALVVSREVDSNLPKIMVDDTNKELVNIVTKFYDYPSTKMKMIGITGTDGKTTTSTIIYKLLNKIEKTGYIGTNGIECDTYKDTSSNTTPTPEHLHRYLNNLYTEGCKNIVLEAGSEGLAQNRCESILFDYSIFTNLTHEHLNFHKTMDNYLNAKGLLFEKTKKNGYSIINIDDGYSSKIIEKANGNIVTFGQSNDADFKIYDVLIEERKTSYKLKYKDTIYDIDIPLLGLFNVYNMTAALSLLTIMGHDINDLRQYFNELFVDCRMNEINLGQNFKVIIDFAHTPNAILNLLTYINTLKRNRIISVSGSAGGRDKEKRPMMGEILVNKSDYVIFTYDDPREEDVNDIIDQMVGTVKDKDNKYERIIDRKDAIKKAIDIAEKDDIVLIIGRGNETTVPINKELIYMSDFDEVKKALSDRIKRNS